MRRIKNPSLEKTPTKNPTSVWEAKLIHTNRQVNSKHSNLSSLADGEVLTVFKVSEEWMRRESDRIGREEF